MSEVRRHNLICIFHEIHNNQNVCMIFELKQVHVTKHTREMKYDTQYYCWRQNNIFDHIGRIIKLHIYTVYLNLNDSYN